MKRNFRTLETLGKPVVRCSTARRSAAAGKSRWSRIAASRVDDPKIQFGLPEVTLGLIPGATGITKMVRLLGLMAAQPYILEEQAVRPARGARAGAGPRAGADAPAACAPAALAWIAAQPAARSQPWDDKDYGCPGGTPANPKIAGMLAWRRPMLRAEDARPVPGARGRAGGMVEGAQVDFDTALRIESRYLAKLVVSARSRRT